jgi:hypothetical protein
MRKIDKGLNARTMTDLIIPSFDLINEYLLSKNIKTEWIKEPEKHEIKFTGPGGEAGAFSARAENRWKKQDDLRPFPVVVFNFRIGNLSTTNNGSDPIEGFSPRRIMSWFKGIFWLWFE